MWTSYCTYNGNGPDQYKEGFFQSCHSGIQPWCLKYLSFHQIVSFDCFTTNQSLAPTNLFGYTCTSNCFREVNWFSFTTFNQYDHSIKSNNVTCNVKSCIFTYAVNEYVIKCSLHLPAVEQVQAVLCRVVFLPQ